MAKILLVEDDNNLREIYEARLTAEGYQIIAAQNGEEALVLAKQHHPELVISDVMMPRISGYEMLDILRNTEELKDTKVIMLTALGQAEDKDRAGKLGADKYLVKSQVTLEDIVNSAKSLLSATTQPQPVTTTADDATALGASAALPSASDPLVATTTDAPVPNPDPEPTAQEATADQVMTPPDPQTTVPQEAPSLPLAPLEEAPVDQPTINPAQTPAQEEYATPLNSPATPPTAPPMAAVPEPSGTPVSVEDVIESQPDAQGQIEASAEKVEQVQSTPLGETDLLTGEQKVIADEEAALAAQMSGEPQPEPPLNPTPASALTFEPNAVAEATPEVPPVGTEITPAGATLDPAPLAAPPLPVAPTTPEMQSEQDEVIIAPSEPVPTSTLDESTPVATPVDNPQSTQTDPESVTVSGKKVIQPPADMSSKPDLNQLLAAEEEKEASANSSAPATTPTPVQPPATSQPVQPPAVPKASDGFDPNSVAL